MFRNHDEDHDVEMNDAPPNIGVRGASRGLGVDRVIEATGQRLPVHWDLQYKTPIGVNASSFCSEIGTLVRMYVPLQYSTKKQLPNEVFTGIAERLPNKFDVDYSDDQVKGFIYHEIGNRYKDYRSRLYKHYQKMGGSRGGSEHPYKNVSLEDWKILCEKWETPAWQEKSEKTKKSRSMLPYNHCAGTKSFLCHREEKKLEDGTYLSNIDIFKHTHWSVENGWVDPLASEQHEKMVALKEEQVDSSTPMSDDEIMAAILGERKSYVRGMGYGAKPPNKKKSPYSHDYVQSLESQLANMKEQMETQRSTMEMRDQENERRFTQLNEENERRFTQVNEENERRFNQLNDVLARLGAKNSSQTKD